MTKIKKVIPSKISIGGQDIVVEFVDRLDGVCQLGECSTTGNYIKIAESTENMPQSKQSKRRSFWHEVTHLILDAMGEYKLNSNEKFICCFSSLLTEMTKNCVFLEDDKKGGMTHEEFNKQD